MTDLEGCVNRLQRRLAAKLRALRRPMTAENVHDARSAARRLSAVLALFKRELPPPVREYLRGLRRLTRDLGELRDADVVRESVAALAPKPRGRYGDELRSLERALESQRVGLARALQAQWSTASPFARPSAPWGEALPSVTAKNEPNAMEVAALLARRRRRLRARLRKWQRPAQLHGLRRKVRMLRYALEEMQHLGVRPTKLELAALVKLQDILGKLQDLSTLRHELRRHRQHRKAVRELRAQAAIRRRRLLRDFKEYRSSLLRDWRSERRLRRAEPVSGLGKS